MVVQLLSFKLVAQVSLRFLHVHNTHHSAQVSLCLQMDCHLFAALENSLLGSGPCLSLVSLNSMRQNLNPTLDSPGRLKCLNMMKSFALRSVGFLKPNMPTSISLPQPLLRSYFPECSSTWCSPCQLKENGCERRREIHGVEQTKKMVPFITREATLWSTSPQVGSWCQ